jgi:hypothetical protein
VNILAALLLLAQPATHDDEEAVDALVCVGLAVSVAVIAGAGAGVLIHMATTPAHVTNHEHEPTVTVGLPFSITVPDAPLNTRTKRDAR